MHHAAMANKKEMMFTLARLGCDWRARADGIDGATAAFVLCGQHGKTTRQQVRSLPRMEAAPLMLSGVLTLSCMQEARMCTIIPHIVRCARIAGQRSASYLS